MDEKLARILVKEIRNVLTSVDNDEVVNIVDGLFVIAKSIFRLANAVDRLGTNNAATPMGAIEMLSLEVKNGMESLSENIGFIAEAVSNLE